MAKNHQCQVAVEKMSNMTLSFNRWNISNIDKALLAALAGNYILYTMYCFGHCSRKRNFSEARKSNWMDKLWKWIQHKMTLKEVVLFGPSKQQLEAFKFLFVCCLVLVFFSQEDGLKLVYHSKWGLQTSWKTFYFTRFYSTGTQLFTILENFLTYVVKWDLFHFILANFFLHLFFFPIICADLVPLLPLSLPLDEFPRNIFNVLGSLNSQSQYQRLRCMQLVMTFTWDFLRPKLNQIKLQAESGFPASQVNTVISLFSTAFFLTKS